MTLSFIRSLSMLALLLAQATAACADEPGNAYRWYPVSGTGIHYFDDVPGRNPITHSATPKPNGVTLRTTESVDLFGDLSGRVLYQPVTEIDEAAGLLVNTGNQVFSGTVLGSDPMLLHDDEFRVEVNLATGETTGRMYLTNRIAGPIVRCELEIVGTGFTPEGNGLADYSGRCRMLGNPAKAQR